MKNSNSNLDEFISKLMSNDKALQQFLADPTNGGKEFGISKAERAVLRRVTGNLSNKSKNGYGIQRDLGSYRRSLRLLQNVLHKHAATHTAITSSTDGLSTYSFHIYITGDPSNPGAPYGNPSLAYTNYVTYASSGDFTTLGDAMNFNPPASPSVGDTSTVNIGTVSDSQGNPGQLSYTAIYASVGGSTTDFDWYMLEFTLSEFASSINGSYILPYNVTTEREPFWFYSLDGNAISPNTNQGYSVTPGVTEGGAAVSFKDFPLKESTNIVWQPIAPDMDYGFGPCFQTTFTPVVLGIPVLGKLAISRGETFYTNKVSNVIIPGNVSTIKLAGNPDGTGDVFTDDVVSITFTGKAGTYTYTHDYSNNCSGAITGTSPVDLTANLAMFKGQSITIAVEYKDKCGGYVSSGGYYLVFNGIENNILLGSAVANRAANPPGATFYTNTVSNVMISSNVSSIKLACNPDGTGNVYTDDVVTITFTGAAGTYTYHYDYSNGCSGRITPTKPVDLTANLAMFKGQSITVDVQYKDQCGGVESSSGYFLMFD